MSLVFIARSKFRVVLTPFQLLPSNLAIPESNNGYGSHRRNLDANQTRLFLLSGKSERQVGVRSAISRPIHYVSKIGSYPKGFHGIKKRQLIKYRFQYETNSVVPDSRFCDGKPTLEYAETMSKTFASMTNEQVMAFAMLDVPEACRECVIRDIMAVDKINYDEALEVFAKIAKANREDMLVKSFPFRIGFGLSFTGAFLSIPLVFHETTVAWFNQNYVLAELPPATDLETWLEVGTASWGWMEPVLGTVSFFLLCMQFARAQLKNLGIRPYFNWQREHRARNLCKKFPQYDPDLLSMYSKCDRLAVPHIMSD
mmetsp:Transcript_8513/g.17819  ORF Transcript_8513/g.17819 Transcript_8513/m.17819 type:complete len:313 (-) Transcript_8513:337-1275(-)